MKSIMNLRKQRETNKGITLIALVVTIVVLLILAGVTIANITGDKTIIKEARTAKELSEKAALEEQVEVAIIKAEQKHRNPTIDDVIQELKNNKVISKEEQVDKETGDIRTDAGYEIKGKLDDYIGGNPTPNPPASSTVEEAKNTGTVLDENNPTTITDTYGNEIKVPEGFRIATDSATDVTGGVVIEDVRHGATAGSQFVWIPVGTVYTSADKSTSETITLRRYVFNEDGTINAELSKTEPRDELKSSSDDSCYFTEGLKDSTTTNTHAKDIEAFRTSAITNKGYYIGRYEARSVVQRTDATDDLAQVTVEPKDYVYNYVTQPQAATLARGMYGEDKKFTSDLINSYAWDTAIVFLQTFDNRSNKTKPYARQNSLNTGSVAVQGTNNLEDETKQDKICNIWDMASNGFEWNTESSSTSVGPCVRMGGAYRYSSMYTSFRGTNKTSAYDYNSFRCALYLQN